MFAQAAPTLLAEIHAIDLAPHFGREVLAKPLILSLVARFSQIDGYRCLSLMRAFGVVKCQLALA